MIENEIIAEIHRARAEHARECNYDVDVIFAKMGEELERLKAEGWKVVSLPPRRIEEETCVLLEEPPPIDKNLTSLPPIIPPTPVQQTIKFTPPKIVKDEEVVDLPPTQEETKDVQVSSQTQEGDKNFIDLPPEPSSDIDEDKIFSLVEESPSFPGGEKKLMEYLSNIKYPVIAREERISGWVVISFIVDKAGKIKDGKVLKGIGGGCNEEALKKIMSMPDWNPGRQNGRKVMVRTILRVNFTLN